MREGSIRSYVGNRASHQGVELCTTSETSQQMPGPLRSVPDRDTPLHLRQESDSEAIGWTLGAVAVVALLGVSYWAWSEHVPIPAKPAVTAAPAAPAQAPDTTTGQAPRTSR